MPALESILEAPETLTAPPAAQKLVSLESVFHAAPIGLAALDLDFRYAAVNERLARMYYLKPADFVGRTVEEVLPGPAPQILAHFRSALSANAMVECEIFFDHSGSLITGEHQEIHYTFLRTAQPIHDEAGEVVGISVALIDITARKLAEAALKDSEENLRYTVELTPHIPWTASPTGELTFMSPRWHEITGTSPNPTLLKRWILGVHEDDRALTLSLWRRAIDTGTAFDTDYRLRCVNSEWRWHRARAYPRRNDRHEIVLWYGTIEDIHDRKEAETALNTKTAMLEATTRELHKRAYEDHLTGLANRRTFDNVLLKEIERARSTGLPLAFILLDVDHFKRFNDTHGHSAGDEALRAVARAIRDIVRRPGDLAARFGGEEFAVILPNTTPLLANQLARQINAAVRNVTLYPLEEGCAGRRSSLLTVSAGVSALTAVADVPGTELAQTLIDEADQALYQAKSGGRDRTVSFTSR